MKHVSFSPKADKDIDACVLWLRDQNPLIANKFLVAVEKTASKLARMPSLGSRQYADIAL